MDEAAHPTGEDGFVSSLSGKVALEQGLVDGPQVARKGDNGEGVDGCGDAQPGAGGEDATKTTVQVLVLVHTLAVGVQFYHTLSVCLRDEDKSHQKISDPHGKHHPVHPLENDG